MKKQNFFDKTMPRIYVLLIAISLIVIVLVAIGEGTNGWNSYKNQSSQAGLSKINYQLVKDGSAKCGKLKIYDFDITGNVNDNDYVTFFLVHSNSWVYIDGKLKSSVVASGKALIGSTTGSYYSYIPLTRENAGSHIQVIVEPIYKNVIKNEVEFSVDQSFSLISKHFRHEFWQVILSLVIIISGLVFFLTSAVNFKNSQNEHIGYLSAFSMLIGVWKLMDVRMIPELIEVDPKLTSYVSLTMLLLVVPPFVFFTKKQLSTKFTKLMDYSFIYGCLTIALSIVLQIFGVLDYRETLVLTHISIILALLAVSVSVISEFLSRKNDMKFNIVVVGFLLFVSGAIADFIPFYLTGEPTDFPYTLFSFILFTFISGAVASWETNKEAVTDLNTGLYNRGRCTEILSDNTPLSARDGVCVLMLDLNYLKRVNDNFGHAEGDKLILAFANIIHSKLPAGSFVGRFGGDEFLAVLYDTTEEEIEKTISDIRESVEQYNSKKDRIPISFSEGYAFSMDMPGKTIHELFKEADEKMYISKRRYHKDNESSAYMKGV